MATTVAGKRDGGTKVQLLFGGRDLVAQLDYLSRSFCSLRAGVEAANRRAVQESHVHAIVRQSVEDALSKARAQEDILVVAGGERSLRRPGGAARTAAWLAKVDRRIDALEKSVFGACGASWVVDSRDPTESTNQLQGSGVPAAEASLCVDESRLQDQSCGIPEGSQGRNNADVRLGDNLSSAKQVSVAERSDTDCEFKGAESCSIQTRVICAEEKTAAVDMSDRIGCAELWASELAAEAALVEKQLAEQVEVQSLQGEFTRGSPWDLRAELRGWQSEFQERLATECDHVSHEARRLLSEQSCENEDSASSLHLSIKALSDDFESAKCDLIAELRKVLKTFVAEQDVNSGGGTFEASQLLDEMRESQTRVDALESSFIVLQSEVREAPAGSVGASIDGRSVPALLSDRLAQVEACALAEVRDALFEDAESRGHSLCHCEAEAQAAFGTAARSEDAAQKAEAQLASFCRVLGTEVVKRESLEEVLAERLQRQAVLEEKCDECWSAMGHRSGLEAILSQAKDYVAKLNRLEDCVSALQRSATPSRGPRQENAPATPPLLQPSPPASRRPESGARQIRTVRSSAGLAKVRSSAALTEGLSGCWGSTGES